MLQCVAVCCSALQCVAVCCSVLQCVAVCCSVSLSLPSPVNCEVSDKFFQCVAVRCSSVLQCVAVCCSVLLCVALRVSIFQAQTIAKFLTDSFMQRRCICEEVCASKCSVLQSVTVYVCNHGPESLSPRSRLNLRNIPSFTFLETFLCCMNTHSFKHSCTFLRTFLCWMKSPTHCNVGSQGRPIYSHTPPRQRNRNIPSCSTHSFKHSFMRHCVCEAACASKLAAPDYSRCSVLQCVAVCCSVLQYTFVISKSPEHVFTQRRCVCEQVCASKSAAPGYPWRSSPFHLRSPASARKCQQKKQKMGGAGEVSILSAPRYPWKSSPSHLRSPASARK